MYGWYCRSNSLARKLETTQYTSAELIQPRQNMAAPMHRDTAREKSCEYLPHNSGHTNVTPSPLVSARQRQVPSFLHLLSLSSTLHQAPHPPIPLRRSSTIPNWLRRRLMAKRQLFFFCLAAPKWLFSHKFRRGGREAKNAYKK